jgi:hypothetical protein
MSDTTSTGVVVFDYNRWITRYPEFSVVSETLAQMYFDEAGLFLSNVAAGPMPWLGPIFFVPSTQIADLTQRAMLLNMLTAHIAKLNGWPGQGGAAVQTGLVGPINSASEGSVSVNVTPLAGSSSNALWIWLAQTQYGAEFWAATAGYRMARYYPGRTPYLGVGPRFFGRGGYGW